MIDIETKCDFLSHAKRDLAEAQNSLNLAGETDLAALVESVLEFVTCAKQEAEGLAEQDHEANDYALRMEYERSAI